MNPNAMGRATAVFSVVAGVAGLGGCWSAKIDLSSEATENDGGAAIATPGSSGSSSATAAHECFADAGLVDGTGYSGLVPSWCGDAPGAPLAFPSPADVTAAVPGTWIDCDDPNFFSVLAGPVNGVQITSDGHIESLYVDGETKLANPGDFTPFSGSAGSSGFSPESTNAALAMATYAIVDSSATLGAGTFQMRITGSDGSIEQAQILVWGSPDRIKLVLGNESVTLVRAVSFQYRAGVCSPAFSGGTAMQQGGSPFAGLSAGRWIWCGGEGIPAFSYGFDMQDDGGALQLGIDWSGNFVAADGGGLVQWPLLQYPQPLPPNVSTCPAALEIVNPEPIAGPLGFYQPIPPQ
jgi:hypothetical protein